MTVTLHSIKVSISGRKCTMTTGSRGCAIFNSGTMVGDIWTMSTDLGIKNMGCRQIWSLSVDERSGNIQIDDTACSAGVHNVHFDMNGKNASWIKTDGTKRDFTSKATVGAKNIHEMRVIGCGTMISSHQIKLVWRRTVRGIGWRWCGTEERSWQSRFSGDGDEYKWQKVGVVTARSKDVD